MKHLKETAIHIYRHYEELTEEQRQAMIARAYLIDSMEALVQRLERSEV